MITFEIEGLDALKREWESAQDALASDLRDASLAAAEDGIEEAQRNHPYRDRTHNLTGNAHAVPVKTNKGEGIAVMVWDANYGSYVDKGTSRSKPYPFTPQANQRAEKSLEIRATLAAEDCASRMNE